MSKGVFIRKKIVSLALTAILALTTAFAFSGCNNQSEKITVAVPNDITNEARALLLLEDLGYIEHRRGKHQRDQHLYLFLPHTG